MTGVDDDDIVDFRGEIDGVSELESIPRDKIAEIATSRRGTYEYSKKETVSIWNAIRRGTAGKINSITLKTGWTISFSMKYLKPSL